MSKEFADGASTLISSAYDTTHLSGQSSIPACGRAQFTKRYNPLKHSANIIGAAGHPYLIPLLVANYSDRLPLPATTVLPSFNAYHIILKNGF